MGSTGDLNLGHILSSVGLDDLAEVLVLRHTFTADGLRKGEVTAEAVKRFAREQDLSPLKFPAEPPRLWLNFIADGGRRSRFWGTLENHGEVVAERTETLRYYDLQPSDVLSSLSNRLVIEWGKDTINWAKRASAAAAFPIIEIADPEAVPFPGYDNVILTRADLVAIVEDSRFAAWRTALGAVQGIYLIADRFTGRQYVGKADGSERILGRWAQYAKDGHGGNVALKALSDDDPNHARHFQWSLLRVFGPSTPQAEVDAAETHFKRALLTREFGLNRN